MQKKIVEPFDWVRTQNNFKVKHEVSELSNDVESVREERNIMLNIYSNSELRISVLVA